MDAHTLYEQITKNLKMGDAYEWAKDYFGVWHRSKVGVLIGNRAFYFGFSAYWNAGPGLVQGRKVETSRVVALLEHAGMAFH